MSANTRSAAPASKVKLANFAHHRGREQLHRGREPPKTARVFETVLVTF